MANEMQHTKQDVRLKTEPSLGELFSDFSRGVSTLVRQEVDLARTELTAKASRLGKDLGFLAIGGAVLYAGLLTLIATVVIALSYAMPWWLAALIVGVVVTVCGYALVQRGLSAMRKEQLAPRQTLETLKEDAQWAKQQTR
jgi:xanthine/uracil permease